MASLEQSQEEKLLRENIRKAIRIVLDRRSAAAERERLEEQTLRGVIRKLISEAKNEIPLDSTAMNRLRDVLNNIVPNIKRDYKSLTTSKEQRESFRLVLMSAIENLLQTTEMNLEAGTPIQRLAEILNELDVEIGREEEEGIIPLDIEGEEDQEELDFAQEIGLEVDQLDKTGRDQAIKTFNNSVKSQVQQPYVGLGDIADREEFAEYLLKNVEKHLDNAEEELAQTVDQLEVGTEERPEEREEAALEEFVNLDELLSNL